MNKIFSSINLQDDKVYNTIRNSISGRNLGLDKDYLRYVNSLDNDELKKEYYQTKVSSENIELIIKLILTSVYLGILWQIIKFVLGMFKNIDDIANKFTVSSDSVLTMIIGFSVVCIIISISITIIFYMLMRSFMIKKKRKIYLEGLLKDKNLWNNVGGV